MQRFRPHAYALPALVALMLVGVASAQDTGGADHSAMGHGAHGAHGAQAPDDSPASVAFRDANAAMHSAMDIPMTGNADVDFIAGMIPHHEGAVAMARIVLEHGSDPDVRQLAESVIAAQEAEIAWMKDWLARNGQ